MKKYNFIGCVSFIILMLASFANTTTAQNNSSIKGKISEISPLNSDSLSVLPFANIVWKGTTIGTTSDENGNFEIKKIAKTDDLVISYTGYKSDTVCIDGKSFLDITLKSSSLASVTVESNVGDLVVSQNETITTNDLKKDACCTLSESFQTNASVDATTADAVTGSRQIKMLGLDGVYSQLLIEGMPMMRGLNIRSGLQFIPGTWVSSIDINKGAGSVVNGYESITGQINTQLVSPKNTIEKNENLLNLYFNPSGRLEANLNLTHHINSKWNAVTLLHASSAMTENDRNNDDFLDMPKYYHVNALNRWKYNGKKINAQFGIRLLDEKRFGGQLDYEPTSKSDIINNDISQQFYGVEMNTRRIEGWAKLGFFLGDNFSIGNQITANYHELNQIWGQKFYEGQEEYFFYNGISDWTISDKHLLRSGVSFVYNNTSQNYIDYQNEPDEELILNRKEYIPAIFAEYTFNRDGDFTAVAGVRSDFHNLYGTQISPRLNLKWNPAKNTVFRASAGRGFRVANPIVENSRFFASSRTLTMNSDLQPEIAWNTGASFVQGFNIAKRKGKITVDFYRTDFENQVVLNVENPSEIRFDNLDGKSYANSFQIQAEYEFFQGFKAVFAYKYYDVKTTIENELVSVPYTTKNRFFTNLEYQTKNKKWAFDWTGQVIGSQRLPDSYDDTNNNQVVASSESSAYFLMNAQITRNFTISNKPLEVYVGGENLTNYSQTNPILNSENPFGNNFDTSNIYAPIMGTMGYMGLRFYF
ncbi:outer membrane receptor protein [Bernardetia litoralis DSM 6794]|uniref:Outer membrane receptor protein n=1 Tax=Bernardetia litoralis (strain ATCC 23117 / DSM 6794 / NBRC 15988 / NCIMB 1366 / Fx l1 / Sio-4) TaxID=880071 RepID=I4APQ3_BERLS|nr:TonB-dependent receptor [Bernardetia litoralis]AFM05938.1 outer membrane receptor protein [Bernardetia litoralis DSM 6794]